MKSLIKPTSSSPLLRPPASFDTDFLYRVYLSTRAEELDMLIDWSDEQKEIFFRGQFLAQHAAYHQNYHDASFDVIELDGEKIGRFYVAYMESEIRIIDIALLPPFRNRGIGSELIRILIHEAEATGRFVSLHVTEHNPAKRLYERLGFRVASEDYFYTLMEWHSSSNNEAGGLLS
ncbi:MAG: GNAT family N-acetyltransferase [Methylomicrobium sp.]|nr:GNAT family N-acetyltransferase [Methylomicrobium sp.]